MKILYLHGMDSHLQDDRRAVLEPYAEVYAPLLDYRNSPDLFSFLQSQYADIQAIIGSSAGGLVGYYLAQQMDKPCLLFNPALPFRNETPFFFNFNKNYEKYMRIVIGLQDEIISPWQSIDILKQDFKATQNAEIQLINQMKHSYPIEIFSKEVAIFFKNIE